MIVGTTSNRGESTRISHSSTEGLEDLGGEGRKERRDGRAELTRSLCSSLSSTRPGLPAFLKELSKLYEMHVYTMGTRAYAEKVCEVIDPKGEFFGRRILSRDESGSEFELFHVSSVSPSADAQRFSSSFTLRSDS